MFSISNKYLTKDQQMKRNFWKGFGICSLFILVIISVYQIAIIPLVREAAKEKALKGEKTYEYLLNNDIKQGTPIDIDKDFTRAYMDTTAVPENSITDPTKIKGMVARINISKKTAVTADMFVVMNDYVTQDLRNQDYSDIVLSKNLKVGDYVDIRYKKKDGTDFITVAKKKVLSLNGSTAVYNINEGERQYKNNAAVAASLTGGILYTTIYVDSQNQEPAKVTYLLDANIEKSIKSDPNLVKQSEQTLQQRNQSESKNTSSTEKPQYASGTGGNN